MGKRGGFKKDTDPFHRRSQIFVVASYNVQVAAYKDEFERNPRSIREKRVQVLLEVCLHVHHVLVRHLFDSS